MKNKKIADESTESQAGSRPSVNWRPELPRSENLKREATDLLPGVTFARLFDAADYLVRKRMIRDSKIDFPIAVLRARKQLEAHYDAYLRSGEMDKAFGVLREQIKLLSLANHLQPLTESDLRDERRDPYAQALTELDPADRYETIRKQQALEVELRRSAFEKTGRNPDGSKKVLDEDPAGLERKIAEGSVGPMA